MEIRAAKAHERDEIVDLIAAVFVEKCRPRYASQHYQDSSYELDQSRVCVVDGKIVSYVRVSNRSMYIGEAVDETRRNWYGCHFGGVPTAGLFVSVTAGCDCLYGSTELRPQPSVYHYPTILHAAWVGILSTDLF